MNTSEIKELYEAAMGNEAESQISREAASMLVQCAKLLGDRITWQDRLHVLHAMIVIRHEANQMMAESQYLADAYQGEPTQ